jgi:hypothetical protein
MALKPRTWNLEVKARLAVDFVNWWRAYYDTRLSSFFGPGCVQVREDANTSVGAGSCKGEKPVEMLGDLYGSFAGSIPEKDVLDIELYQGVDGSFRHASSTDDKCSGGRCY